MIFQIHALHYTDKLTGSKITQPHFSHFDICTATCYMHDAISKNQKPDRIHQCNILSLVRVQYQWSVLKYQLHVLEDNKLIQRRNSIIEPFPSFAPNTYRSTWTHYADLEPTILCSHSLKLHVYRRSNEYQYYNPWFDLTLA